MYLTDWISRSTEPYTEHGSSVMVLLILGTEGLFYSLRKDNDNLCNTLCCNMHVLLDRVFFFFFFFFFYPFHWFFEWKKAAHSGKRNWPIKRLHMFLILKMFPFNCPWGTERITFVHTRIHMTWAERSVLGGSQSVEKKKKKQRWRMFACRCLIVPTSACPTIFFLCVACDQYPFDELEQELVGRYMCTHTHTHTHTHTRTEAWVVLEKLGKRL